jgi:hypothetical protein
MPTSPVLPKAYEMDQVLKSRRAQRAVLLPIFKKKNRAVPGSRGTWPGIARSLRAKEKGWF